MGPIRNRKRRQHRHQIAAVSSKRRKVSEDTMKSDESSPISDAEAEVKYWEKKLGLDGDKADKVKEEFIKDGWDEDFFKSLDEIDDAVKERKKELKAEGEAGDSKSEVSEEDDKDIYDIDEDEEGDELYVTFA
mmetsp:Transcript_15147/g.12610  ORF Transcript_15147/g.12610 Transcript_15147/m.12610 type:complete len:133 (+) Transcript_15147:40-438(+)